MVAAFDPAPPRAFSENSICFKIVLGLDRQKASNTGDIVGVFLNLCFDISYYLQILPTTCRTNICTEFVVEKVNFFHFWITT